MSKSYMGPQGAAYCEDASATSYTLALMLGVRMEVVAEMGEPDPRDPGELALFVNEVSRRTARAVADWKREEKITWRSDKATATLTVRVRPEKPKTFCANCSKAISITRHFCGLRCAELALGVASGR